MDLKLKAKMGLAFLAYSLRLTKVPVGPLYVTVETGNKCNLRCPMCPQSTRPDDFPEGHMPIDEFEKLLRRVDRFSPIACLTLHLSARGANDHHMAEAAFKELARALRGAVAFDSRRAGVPSTKGTL